MLIDAIAFLSSAAMTARKAESFQSETYVVDLADLRKIIQEMQEDASESALTS